MENATSYLVEGEEGLYLFAQVVNCCIYEMPKTIEKVCWANGLI